MKHAEWVDTYVRPNPNLVLQKGLSGPVEALLEDTYGELRLYLLRPSMYFENPSEAIERVRHLESQLQRLWGFPQDERFFYYEFWIDGCTCPKLDNEDAKGTKYRFFNTVCPIHNKEGWEDESNED